MALTVEEVIALIRKLSETVEDIWIAQQKFRKMLTLQGLPDEQLDEIQKQALADPKWRKLAHKQFEAMRRSLEASGKEAVIEDLLSQPPPAGKPN